MTEQFLRDGLPVDVTSLYAYPRRVKADWDPLAYLEPCASLLMSEPEYTFPVLELQSKKVSLSTDFRSALETELGKAVDPAVMLVRARKLEELVDLLSQPSSEATTAAVQDTLAKYSPAPIDFALLNAMERIWDSEGDSNEGRIFSEIADTFRSIYPKQFSPAKSA